MNRKIRVGILFGGKSAEHEVSLQSAQNVLDAIDREKYEPVMIGIDKQGKWHLDDGSMKLLNPHDPKLITLQGSGHGLALVPGETETSRQMVSLAGSLPAGAETIGAVDVVFPILHGPFGEDGTVQGMLRMANIPFVGAGVLGSAVGMDKDVMKRLLRDAGLPIANFIALTRATAKKITIEEIAWLLGFPVFVKPANLGSSVGIHKVMNAGELQAALDDAFRFDNKVLVEEFIEGREIECAVLGNEEPIASVPGEIIPQHEWYSYEAKYIDEKGALLKIPADLSEHLTLKLRTYAVDAFRELCCEGMARVDFFLRDEEEIFVNEINTIPGFTRISMYPKLWEASGISYTELIDRLIQLALQRHERDSALRTSYGDEA